VVFGDVMFRIALADARDRRRDPPSRPVAAAAAIGRSGRYHASRICRSRIPCASLVRIPLLPRPLVLAVLLAVAFVTGGCGSEGRDGPTTTSGLIRPLPSDRSTVSLLASAPEAPKLSRHVYGSGARAVRVVRPAGRGVLPGVLFLHGWGYQRPADYRAWVDHLPRPGNAMIVPTYQLDERSDPAGVRAAAVAGLRRALREDDVDTSQLAIVGHSAGAAIGADYVVVARSLDLPRPVAVVVYPGRRILGTPGIPQADPTRFPSQTALLVMAGASDTIVGRQPAEALVDAARRVPRSRRGLIIARDRRVATHLAPLSVNAVVRRTFWARADAFIARARARSR
jgi:acetyl esterase/lipase